MPLHRSRGRRPVGRVLENVDCAGVRFMWESLEVDEQLSLLRFEDPKLVKRLYFLRTELLRSDLACYQRGIFTRDLRGQASMALMLDAFEFDLKPSAHDEDERSAFITKAIFVERDNFFDLIEEELGGFLADGRPNLRRSQWVNLFDATPSSWMEFLRQVLRLIELALLDAYDQHQQRGQQQTPPESVQPHCSSEDAGEEHLLAALVAPDSPQQGAGRRRARKLRKKGPVDPAPAAVVAASAECRDADLSRDSTSASEAAARAFPTSEFIEAADVIVPRQECSSESCGDTTLAEQLEDSLEISLDGTEQLEDSLETSLDGTATSAGESQALSKSSSTGSMPSLSSHDDASLNGTSSAQEGHAYATLFGPPPTILVPPAQNQSSADANVTYSAWVCNELMGGSAEWHWVAFEQVDAAPVRHLRAHVRNTFLDLSPAVDGPARSLHLRARSADAARDGCHRFG